MQPKQKVTLYFPEEIHNQLRIRAAIDHTSMSEITEQAVAFYLAHPHIVQANGIGHTHQVYNCPSCSETLVIRDGDLYAVAGSKPTLATNPTTNPATSQVSSQIYLDTEVIN
ncbi:MAG: hypothetical protein SFT94_07215 [Pseudanabaenaceae cyanobacterium bins.68]|nr:hypothetical protein [Pseudanabaenaceae cyanobacterium bins.68]